MWQSAKEDCFNKHRFYAPKNPERKHLILLAKVRGSLRRVHSGKEQHAALWKTDITSTYKIEFLNTLSSRDASPG